MKKLVAVAMFLIAPFGTSWAGSLDLSLSNETANMVYVFSDDPLDRNGQNRGEGGSELGLGVFFNERSDNLLHATLLARGYRHASSSQYQVSAGMKMLGGEIGIEEFDEDSTFEGFYAPSITSFADAERYGEVAVRLQIEIMSRARAYIGYRRIRFDTVNFENVSLDRGAHFGLNIAF